MAHGIAGAAHGVDGKARRAAGRACGVRRVVRPRAKMAKYLFRAHYQRLSESYFALCCTLLHSFALFVHRFVGFRTFASEIRGSLPPAPPKGGVTRNRGASHSSRRRDEARESEH